MAYDLLRNASIPDVSHSTTRELILSWRVPLDHGKHDCTHSPKATLGTLHAFPAELQQRTVSYLDIKSFLEFRRVSKLAMHLVNSLLEYQKIMTHAPTALRMAIAIKTHHRYTISDLFAALCQRHCEDCGTLAHYVCLFTCRRICLSQEKYCEGSLAPCLVRSDPTGVYGITRGVLGHVIMVTDIPDNVPRFWPVPGFYMHTRIAGEGGKSKYHLIRNGDSYVDMNYILPGWKLDIDPFLGEKIETEMVLKKSISAVVAPRLSKMSWGAEYGMHCPICNAKTERRIDWLEPCWDASIDIRQYDVWTKEELGKHMREEHGVVEKLVQVD
ncbi:hypothetical protein COCC4DRAFT_61163 [Bipolaris maydis ATCC 48331]|uniref:F-box domain-containing protein n=2 Tax=Cochliobolus heterostrophus TaxID=5016 RepID=M2UH92_COCH5|nr:uncharacterized protein COCC4DRAFT_61163 [Bipolaris maydis ATCC 48331]EMD93061.1 hypothetical protein COCHEDRAFT_1097636 [Bipolaris maydis C5]KAH7558526.1 hypothetical protein BM1_04663 [Bipolaris maydis]ENI04550.1 hypothetical protein COCC4DRAFT_61163 [Bipolaris maydis ATCC 48331]KAJ5025885.1 hypothetical protein J3E73DRAFT_257486 [Bipolaris maydis]KAJ5056417.1 hypothetical protein J3E74DRAFT_431559 [Bipolaris maydis]